MQADELQTAKIKVIGTIIMNAPALLSSGFFNTRVTISLQVHGGIRLPLKM